MKKKHTTASGDAANMRNLMKTCGVSSVILEAATDSCISRASIDRFLKTGLKPSLPLLQIVIRDILSGLRYAYATKTLPIAMATTGKLSARRHEHKHLTTIKMQEAINAARDIGSSS